MQGRQGQFLAGKASTVAATLAAAVPLSILQNPGKAYLGLEGLASRGGPVMYRSIVYVVYHSKCSSKPRLIYLMLLICSFCLDICHLFVWSCVVWWVLTIPQCSTVATNHESEGLRKVWLRHDHFKVYIFWEGHRINIPYFWYHLAGMGEAGGGGAYPPPPADFGRIEGAALILAHPDFQTLRHTC